MINSSEKLLGCPFCGAQPKKLRLPTLAWVHCQSCDVIVQVKAETIERATKIWNTRANERVKTHYLESENYDYSGTHWIKMMCRLRIVEEKNFLVSTDWKTINCKMCMREREYRAFLEQRRKKAATNQELQP